MSARSLTFRHMAKAVKLARNGGDAIDEPGALGPDQMRLYSFYKPSLLANDYVIEATQSITATLPDKTTQTLQVLNTRATDQSRTLAPQEFEVVVPRFTIDSKIINSYYPPDGHQDEGRILPHIVFNDPHFPWEIPAGVTQNMDGRIDPQVVTDSNGKKTTIYRSMVPWLALLVFDPEDLHLPTLPDIRALNIPGYTTDSDVAKQTPNGVFSMKVSEYLGQIPDSSRINYKAGYTGDDTGYGELTSDSSAVNVIFPTKTLFRQIFASDQDTDNHKIGVEARKYLSHVRHINTVGFPDAGVEEDGLYSIVLSSRSGTYDSPQPHTQVCHLVSIEHVDSTLGSWLNPPAGGGSDRVGMISLFSWIYSALPPNPVNFVDTMRNLTSGQQMLRTSDDTIAQIRAAISRDGSIKSQAAQVMADRLQMGYTLARWRTQSGEESAAFNRGPLVPQPVTWPPAADIPDCSNTSQDYQILDPQTGLMDLSYSSAWQAGKLLAISDTVFSAALMRFRSLVHNSSANQTRMTSNEMMSRLDLITRIKTSMTIVQAKSSGNTGDPERFRPSASREPAPGIFHPRVRPTMVANVKATVKSATNAGQEIYNEFNLDGPNNSDWVTIHSWLSEKLSLGGIPPQYLIPEPAFIPPESLRFFHIDDFWLDCLLDGALSVANHLDSDDDIVRREIKETFNVYLRKPVPGPNIKPQIPNYGFIIRSKLIKAMPDLRITVAWRVTDNRAPVCRWTKWDDETLMCLLDRQPEELASITLAQPPHQQRFSLGSHLDSSGLTFDLRTLFTKGAPDGEWPEKQFPDPSLTGAWFNFNTRCINVAKMAKDINGALQFTDPSGTQAYIDPTPNSCELGMELSDPSYYFQITPPTTAVVSPRDRQLYVLEPPAPAGTAKAIQSKAILSKATPHIPMPQPAKSTSKTAMVETQPSLASPPPPPHHSPRMQPLPVAASNARLAPRAAAVSTLKSKFNLTVYADYKGRPVRYDTKKYDANDYVATKNIYFYDLIFSIRKNTADSASQYKLLRIDVDIPVLGSAPAVSSNTEALLDANYDGPGLRMLSNLRFIPFLFNNDNAKLHIQLVPRSADDNYVLTINDRRSAELGFRLAEANVSPVGNTTLVTIVGEKLKQPRGEVIITMTEWYSTVAAPAGESVATKYSLIKNDVQDDRP